MNIPVLLGKVEGAREIRVESGGSRVYVITESKDLWCVGQRVDLCPDHAIIQDVAQFHGGSQGLVLATSGTSYRLSNLEGTVEAIATELPMLDRVEPMDTYTGLEVAFTSSGEVLLFDRLSLYSQFFEVIPGMNEAFALPEGLPNLVRKVYVSDSHHCANLIDDTLWCWDENKTPELVAIGVVDVGGNPSSNFFATLIVDDRFDGMNIDRLKDLVPSQFASSVEPSRYLTIPTQDLAAGTEKPRFLENWLQIGTMFTFLDRLTQLPYVELTNFSTVRFSGAQDAGCWISDEEGEEVWCAGVNNGQTGSRWELPAALLPIPIF